MALCSYVYLRVCTHRGLWATLTVGSGGVASHAVATSLGHHSFVMNLKHYAQPTAIANAGTPRVVGVLEDPRPGTKLSAENLLRSSTRRRWRSWPLCCHPGPPVDEPNERPGIDP